MSVPAYIAPLHLLLLLLSRSVATYDDAGNAPGGVAAPLQMLRDDGEDTGEGHVEEAVGLFPPLLELLEVPVEVLEGVIAVILAGNVCAERAELVELLLDVLGGGLDVRPDPLQELFVIHLGAGISDDPDVLGQELVAVLLGLGSVTASSDVAAGRKVGPTRPNSAGNCTISQHGMLCGGQYCMGYPTVFFLARSPEAPRTTMTVLSLSSMALRCFVSLSSTNQSIQQRKKDDAMLQEQILPAKSRSSNIEEAGGALRSALPHSFGGYGGRG